MTRTKARPRRPRTPVPEMSVEELWHLPTGSLLARFDALKRMPARSYPWHSRDGDALGDACPGGIIDGKASPGWREAYRDLKGVLTERGVLKQGRSAPGR